MTGEAGAHPKADGPREECIVCLKPVGAGEQQWTVHFRGSRYVVCCPSCVQQFNRAPRQFVEPA